MTGLHYEITHKKLESWSFSLLSPIMCFRGSLHVKAFAFNMIPIFRKNLKVLAIVSCCLMLFKKWSFI